jgi:hypothetical protein
MHFLTAVILAARGSRLEAFIRASVRSWKQKKAEGESKLFYCSMHFLKAVILVARGSRLEAFSRARWAVSQRLEASSQKRLFLPAVRQ